MFLPFFVNNSSLASFTLSRFDVRLYIITTYRSICEKTDAVSNFLKAGSLKAITASDTSSYALHACQHEVFPLP